MKKKEEDRVEMKRRKSKNSHWTCCKRSEGTYALWRIANVASCGIVFRSTGVFDRWLGDRLTVSGFRWWTEV